MKKDYCNKPFKCMVSIGDSITVGYSATRKEYSWSYRLYNMISQFQEQDLRYFNSGISGNLISPGSRAYYHEDSGKPSGVERFERDVIQHEPDLVILAFGLNDLRCGTPVDTFLKELDSIVMNIQKKLQALIVVVNTYFITGYKAYPVAWDHADIDIAKMYNSHMQKYAEENGLLYADIFSAQGEADWVVDRDMIHPNNLGHLLIANKIFETIATNCSCLSIKPYKESEGYRGWGDELEMPLRNYNGI